MIRAIAAFLLLLSVPVLAEERNYHVVGWLNTLIPGSGQMALGDRATGLTQAGYEISTFVAGYEISGKSVFSLDGYTSREPTDTLRRGSNVSFESEITGDMLQEFGIKAHMVNTFEVYRMAARKSAGGLPDDIESRPMNQLFLDPFRSDNLTNPWVYLPLAGVFSYVMADYFYFSRFTVPRVSRLTPGSNALSMVNQMVWRPTGSGAPEEAFYRGFAQSEFKYMTGSPVLGVLMSTGLFSLSHAPEGRVGALVAGSYLGFLCEHFGGSLAPGITLHFWSSVLLGAETVLALNRSQRNSPPSGLSLQVEF